MIKYNWTCKNRYGFIISSISQIEKINVRNIFLMVVISN